MALLSDAIARGTIGSRPAAGSPGRVYFSTEPASYRDNGSSWDDVSDPGTGSGIPDTIVDAKGDLIAATAADTVTRLAVGGTNDHALIVASGETTGLKYGQPLGSLIGITEYILTGTDYQASTTMADVDATNVKVTFTVPANGKVLIHASANVEASVNVHYYWGLRLAAADVANSESKVVFNATGGATIDGRPSYDKLLTGLTPGASVTYKLSHRVNTGTAGFILRDAPIIMTATSAP